ncbi:hypothetical protein BCR34DRAFT_309357 [Clohesyomyces aquaticus]|uniref:Fungal N-terminal domain-containing protein n=1 Tax=Clohesyomyces aquaticus TaxID=1231657 RepID=A0A1Y1ZPI4_9PLEO|nr:hypothetical protein BCR34DRAFT_309357 [Clohesyomyces aquaticus]
MAGFGFSVSDIVTLSSLAWTVYKRCKNAGDEFRSITGDVQSLQAALHLLVDEMDNPNSLIHRSTPAQKQELEQLMQSCTSDLQILEKILAKYSSLRTPDPRFRHKLSFTADRQADIGKKLGGCYQKLDLFLTQLHSGSLARIETNGERNTELLCGIEAKLHAIYEHVLTEAKDPSQLSILDDWDFLQKELVDDNITEIDVKDNRDEITEWVSSLRAGDANRSEKMSSAFTRTDYEIQNPEQSTRTTREDQLESSDSSGDHGYVIRTVSSSSRLYPRIRDEGPNQFHGESRENNEFRKGKHKSRTGNFAGKDYPLSSLVNSTTDTRGSSPSQDSGHASTGSFEARPAMPILAHSTRGSSSRPILACEREATGN